MNSQPISVISGASVSSAGKGRKALFENMKTQQTNVCFLKTPTCVFPVFQIPDQIKEEITAFVRANPFLIKTDPAVQNAVFCTQMLINELTEPLLGRGLINIATSRGNTTQFEKFHADFIHSEAFNTHVLTSPLTSLGNISSEIAAFLATKKNIAVIDSAQTCTSASQAILNGMAWLQSGMADWAIVGGSEAPLTPFTLAQVDALGIYSRDLDCSYPCRPFGMQNLTDTFVLGEGCGLFLLKRTADCTSQLFQIQSWGAAYDQPPSRTGIHNDGRLLSASMQQAIDGFNNYPDLILAHAPGTLKGDRSEWNAIRNTLGKALPHVFSSKYFTGHTYGASSALNIELAAEILNNKTIPKMPFDTYLDHSSRAEIKNVMINATGFGGCAVSILISK